MVIVATAAFTGMTKGEIFSLRWENLDLGERCPVTKKRKKESHGRFITTGAITPIALEGNVEKRRQLSGTPQFRYRPK